VAKELVFENEFATLSYDTESRIVQSVVKQSIPVEKMKELLNKICETLKSRSATKLTTDARKTGILPPEFDEWRRKDWVPRMVRAGWKHWAPVFPPSVITQLHMKRLIKDFQDVGIQVQPVTSPEEALQWLGSQ